MILQALLSAARFSAFAQKPGHVVKGIRDGRFKPPRRPAAKRLVICAMDCQPTVSLHKEVKMLRFLVSVAAIACFAAPLVAQADPPYTSHFYRDPGYPPVVGEFDPGKGVFEIAPLYGCLEVCGVLITNVASNDETLAFQYSVTESVNYFGGHLNAPQLVGFLPGIYNPDLSELLTIPLQPIYLPLRNDYTAQVLSAQGVETFDLKRGETYGFYVEADSFGDTSTLTIAPVTEPATWTFLLGGLGLLGASLRRQRLLNGRATTL